MLLLIKNAESAGVLRSQENVLRGIPGWGLGVSYLCRYLRSVSATSCGISVFPAFDECELPVSCTNVRKALLEDSHLFVIIII